LEKTTGARLPFEVTITEEAELHFRWLSAREQRLLEAAIQARLVHEPAKPSKAVKVLRPNLLAGFELRAGSLRALYNVEGEQVVILVVGRKVGNKLVVKGQEFHGHQDNPAE
jgi:mRNA-degrading endonuclease RelE of RelBE toxin-antitoxin system